MLRSQIISYKRSVRKNNFPNIDEIAVKENRIEGRDFFGIDLSDLIRHVKKKGICKLKLCFAVAV